MTLIALKLFLANVWGWIYSNRVTIAYALVITLALLGAVTLFGFCKSKQPKIDLESVNKINRANEIERKAELEKVVVENADAIKTVDGRNLATEATIEERRAVVAEKVQIASAAVEAAKADGRDVTQAELEELLK